MQRTQDKRQGLQQSRDETHKLETEPLRVRGRSSCRPRHLVSRHLVTIARFSRTQSLYNYCVFITTYLRHRCVPDLRFGWCSWRCVVGEFAVKLSETCRTGPPMSADPVRLRFFCTLLSSHCEHHHTLYESTPPASAAHPAAQSLAQ